MTVEKSIVLTPISLVAPLTGIPGGFKMHEPCHDTSRGYSTAYDAIWKKREAVLKPLDAELHRLCELRKIAYTKEILSAMEFDYRVTDEKRILDAIDLIYLGYGDRPDGLDLSSKYTKYLCAFCPFMDLGCGDCWPSCFYHNRDQRFHACIALQRNVSLVMIQEYLDKYRKSKGWGYLEA